MKKITKNNRKDGNLNLFDFALGLSVGDDSQNSHELEKRILMLREEMKIKDEIIQKKSSDLEKISKKIEELKQNTSNLSSIIENLEEILKNVK